MAGALEIGLYRKKSQMKQRQPSPVASVTTKNQTDMKTAWSAALAQIKSWTIGCVLISAQPKKTS
ncbi:MAG: hypothetical protein CMQ45_06770 [Gammaproteobacteria bacterium]|nr:hypothetical protein [Gammaproteobacteria bacterium]